MTVRLGDAVASAQIGVVGLAGQIELEALRLYGLPDAASEIRSILGLEAPHLIGEAAELIRVVPLQKGHVVQEALCSPGGRAEFDLVDTGAQLLELAYRLGLRLALRPFGTRIASTSDIRPIWRP